MAQKETFTRVMGRLKGIVDAMGEVIFGFHSGRLSNEDAIRLLKNIRRRIDRLIKLMQEGD